METNITATQTMVVTQEDTALHVGSGTLPVLATPRMIAFMEKTACMLVQPSLTDGQTTVGTQVQVRHIAATPVGMEITCTATLMEIDRKRLLFRVEASDSHGQIGEGTHERFIVDSERFLSRAQEKSTK